MNYDRDVWKLQALRRIGVHPGDSPEAEGLLKRNMRLTTSLVLLAMPRSTYDRRTALWLHAMRNVTPFI